MNSDNTPGPWTVSARHGKRPATIVLDANKNEVCEVYAAADLIAAAPDLLAALQSALSDAKPAAHREYWRDGADGESSELVREETWPDWIAAARAAIAKATGA